MAVGLQWQPAALATQLANAKRVCINLHTATGTGAAQNGKLRATARLINRRSRQNQRRKRTERWIKPGGKVTMTNNLAMPDPIVIRSILEID